jgi:hypothetical protein
MFRKSGGGGNCTRVPRSFAGGIQAHTARHPPFSTAPEPREALCRPSRHRATSDEQIKPIT